MPSKTPRKPERPILWIVAGPNGSGKSSLYNRTDIEGWGGSVWIINPDLLTAKIAEVEALTGAAANLVAVQRVEHWLEASIDAYQTIGVETVLSSPKYRRLVQRARSHGFEIRMIYVVLDNADLQLARIRGRVAEGGHDVPADKVVAPRQRSFSELAWFAQQVDECLVFNNSTGEPELIAQKEGGALICWERLPADMTAALVEGGLRLVTDLTDLD
ncbi:AAA family ATPase [Sphingomonas sp. CV7422]|uniref:AAA family ATPase n=1 Tax=Sphingomonas sp. CV7422 TaxID=3018036 RepID=UPI0022FE3345|nr:AAA family ATPase [Sphingomonas sp. CV7422]